MGPQCLELRARSRSAHTTRGKSWANNSLRRGAGCATITRLIAELNADAPPDEQIETYDFPVDQPNNIAYLRGTHLRLEDFTTKPDEVPYRLGFLERGKKSGAILVNAIEQIVPGITAAGLSEEQRIEMSHRASFAGKPLYQQGFWQVLSRVISSEAYQFALDAGGYESTIHNWNAADAIPWFLADFGLDPVYKGFKKGFQQVPLTLAARFEQRGGEVYRDKRLAGFVVLGEGPDQTIELHFHDKSVVRAKALILAMPRRSLELIAPKSPLLQREEVVKLIRSVTPQPLFKLFTTYASSWWLPANVAHGRTVTDLPLRQTYYWPAPVDASPGQAPPPGPPMLMAGYDDGLDIGYWDGFRNRRGLGWRPDVDASQRLEPFRGVSERAGKEAEADPEWLKNHAPLSMVEEAQRQLAAIHGLQFVPEVKEAAFKDWGDDPYGGGWNSWNIGVQSEIVREQMTQPVKGTPVYICGEAYSGAQAWVEGALETADMVLGKMGIRQIVDEPARGAAS